MDMSDSEEAEVTPVGSAEDGLMSLTSVGRTISMPVIQGSTSMTEDWCNSHSASAFHPFSDTDITPITRWVVAFCCEKFPNKLQTTISWFILNSNELLCKKENEELRKYFVFQSNWITTTKSEK